MGETEKTTGTLIKTFKGQRTSETGVEYDTLLLFYRDENGEKKTLFYDRPEVDYYIIKDKNSPEASHPPLYIEKDKVEKHTVYSDCLMRDIAKNTGALGFYDKVRFGSGVNSFEMKNLFKSPLLYEADMDISDAYIGRFYETHKPDPAYKLHKCYFDIETDIYNYVGFPEPTVAPCSVACITLIDEKDMMSYTYILRNPLNQQLCDLEKETDEFERYMHGKIAECDGLDMTFQLLWYDDELTMIKDFFKKVHGIDPDFCGGWNIEYDIQTMQNRLVRLYNKAKDKELPAKKMMAYAMSDEKYMIQKNASGKTIDVDPRSYYSIGSGKLGKRIDSYTVLDGINWIDQMLAYANIHAGSGKQDSYKLDNIANVELGKEKLPFGPGETIRNQLYRNARRFIEYNIRDVLLLLEIEDKTHDIDMVQQLSDITVTRKDKVFMKSIALTNYVNKYAHEKGLVMRTNKNSRYGSMSAAYDSEYLPGNQRNEYDPRYVELFDRKDKYGAFVSDPTLNDKVGVEIFKGKPSKYMFEFVCDEDFSSLYPSIIRTWNLDSTNIAGKFYCIDDKIKKRLKDEYGCDGMFGLSIKDEGTDDDPDDSQDEIGDAIDSADENETDDLCPVMADAMISGDWSSIGTLFFDLPTTEGLINEIDRARDSKRS
jgi:DNA polymerase elongation subunit (family B)